MNSPQSSHQAPSYLRYFKAVTLTLAGAALLFATVPSRLSADPAGLPPTIQFTQGLVGRQVCLNWDAQPGVQYIIQKSATLVASGAPGGFTTVALVTAESGACQWVDPEASGTKGFYRIEIPGPKVFALESAALSPDGGDIFVRGQLLPTGTFLALEIPGQAPIFIPLEPVAGQTGLWRASVSPGAIIGIAIGTTIGARVVDGTGVTVALIDQTIEVTETGYAADAPPWLPPAAPVPDAASNPIPGIGVVVKSNNPPKKGTHRLVGKEECDNGDGDDDGTSAALIAGWMSKKGYEYYQNRSDFSSANTQNNPYFAGNDLAGEVPNSHWSNSLLMPALMKAKEKANRTKCSNNLRQISFSSPISGEVAAEQCDLALPTPAGPQLAWVRSYRSKAPVSSGHGPGWDFSYNIYIEPVPLAAGVIAPVVIVHDGSGRADKFVRQGDGTYRCDGMFREGRFNADTSFTLTFADKGTWIFCPLVGAPWSGRIGSITDRNGVALSFTYNTGQLATVSDAFGRSLSVTWGPTGQISSVADSTGRSVSYVYYRGEPGGTAGDLKSVSCPQEGGLPPAAGPTTFTYTSGFADDRLNHNLASATDGAGRNLGAFTYSPSVDARDLEFDAVASIRQGSALAGDATLIKIGPAPQPPGSFDPTAAYVVYECDELGRVTETTCDRMHRPTMVRDYTGFATPGLPVTATSNRTAGKLRTSDPDFYQTTCLYNGQHLPTRVTMPDGLQERTTYAYELNPAAAVRERANALICELVLPSGEKRTVSMEYQPGFGAPEPELSVSGAPIGGLSINTHPKPKKPHARSAGGDITYVGTCDASEASGISLNGLPPGEPILRGISLNGLPPGVPLRIRSIGPDTEPDLSPIGLNGLPPGEPVFDARMKVSQLSGSLRSSVSARGVGRDGKDCTNPGRPKLGAARLIGVKQKSWTCSNFRINLRTSLGQRFTWTYDAAGNCTSSRTPIAGAGIDLSYNALGQVTTMRTLNGPGSSFTDECVYDPVSRFCTSIIIDSPGLHLTTYFSRDTLGRVTSVTDPRGFDTLFTYNALDQCMTVQSPPVGTSAPARITATCFYDAGGLISGFDVEHRDTTGALVAANPAYSVRYIRESPSRPRLVSRVAEENRPVSLPPGSTDLGSVGLENFDVSDFLFDAAGQIIQESTPAVCRAQPTDSVTSHQYDERGLLHRCIDGQAGTPDAVTTTTECDYTPAGDLSRCATLADASGLPGAVNPTVTFTYDGFRRCTSSTDPMGNVETYVYDNQGSVTCSLFGELDDVPGSTGNVLLSRIKVRFPWGVSEGNRKGPKLCEEHTGMFRSAFFDVLVQNDVITVDRFTATTSAQEITTVHRSPAGLAMSVVTNGDTLVTNTYDTAGRPLTCANGACSVAYTLDAGGNVLSFTRSDFPSAGGNPVVSLIRLATYDALGRAVQISERSNVSSFQYDSLGRETCFQPPVGAPVYSNYDGTSAGAPYSVLTECDVDGDGDRETLGSAYARSCPKRYKIRIHVGGPPRPPIFGRSITNSNGHTTTFTLDSQDRCVQTDHADGTQEFRQFDSLGRCVSDSRQDGTTFLREYNLNGAVTNLYTGPCRPPYLCEFIAVPATLFHYNGRGDGTRITQGTSDIVRTFDSCGDLVGESQNGHIVRHTYTHRGRASTTYPGGARFNESRNAQGLLLSVSAEAAPGTPIASIQYLGYRPAQETRANGVITTYVYRGVNDPPLQGTGPDLSVDACMQTTVTHPSGTVLSRSNFTRDASQRLIRRETLFGDGPNTTAPLRRQVITRDSLGRLTRMITGTRLTAGTAIVPESDVSYTLDLEGQRLSATGGSHPGAYSSSDINPPGDRQMNQYSSWPGGPLEWNDAGSLTLLTDSTSGPKQFVYDAFSRLVSVVDAATGSPLASYTYDACDRMTSSTANSNLGLPPVVTFYIYDGDTCIQELNELGEPQMTFAALGLCIIPINGDPIYLHGGSGHASDALGAKGGKEVDKLKEEIKKLTKKQAARLVTGSTGAVLERFDCDDAGQPIFLTSDGSVRPGASSSLTGYRWMAPECIWSPQSNLFHSPDGTYSPALGQTVSEKTKPKERKKEYVGHVTLMK